MRYLLRIFLLHTLLMLASAASGSDFSLSIADIASPGFSARGIRLDLPVDGSADLHISKLYAQRREFRNVRLRCREFSLSQAAVACRKASLDALPKAALDFSYDFVARHLQLALQAAGGESWRVSGRLGERDWQLVLHNAQAARLAPWLSGAVPTQGALNGTVHLGGNASGLAVIETDLQLNDVAFADASGLHAADKLRGNFKVAARRAGDEWRWQGTVAWLSGEMFWQPLYLRGGSLLTASGRYVGHRLGIEQAVLDVQDMGRVQFSADWDSQQNALLEGVLQGDGLALGSLFGVYAKPFLEKGALAESALYGHADVYAHYRDGGLQSLHLVLHDAGIADAAQRFALTGVNTDVDWQIDAASQAVVSFAGGALLGAPIGSGQWNVQMDGLEFNVPQAVLPILDGRLELHDFHLHRQASQSCADCKPVWHWQFGGLLAPISMERFSTAAGWPKMLGTLAGRIPRVSYDGNEISVDGALLFNVFDGTVVATQLKLADAFGRAPRLYGNLTMRNLDLDLLTRTFSFGNMQGRLDADVNNLMLQDWQPVRFEARLYSSAGRYPKKISQKAVQNISSLGGAGAAAALQRSYLSFFENFGYDRIGLSCVLRNGVCAMGGIAGENHGSYAIIRGGGIPAISVMGYNRAVSWDELVTRLKRVTQDNVTPIVE